jgi:hypothetical protein
MPHEKIPAPARRLEVSPLADDPPPRNGINPRDPDAVFALTAHGALPTTSAIFSLPKRSRHAASSASRYAGSAR